MINAGGVKFGIDITGYKDSINAIKEVKQDLKELSSVFQSNAKEQKGYIRELRNLGAPYQNLAKGVNTTSKLFQKITRLEKDYTSKIRKETARRNVIIQNAERKQTELLQQSMRNRKLIYQQEFRDRAINLRKIIGTSGQGLSTAAMKPANFASWSQTQDARKAADVNIQLEKQLSLQKRIHAENSRNLNVWRRMFDQIKRVEVLQNVVASHAGRTASKFKEFADRTRSMQTPEWQQSTRGTLNTKAYSDLSGILTNIHAGMKKVSTGSNVLRTRMQALATSGVAKVAKGSNKLYSAILRLASVQKRQISLWQRLKVSMSGAGGSYHTWWKRFGVIAVGFAVAYRAINAFERGVQTLTMTFARGLTILDDYTEGLAVISGMIALTYKSSGNFSTRFIAAHNALAKTMEHSIRLAPKYKLSMEEITAGYRELAQFGVIVNPEDAEKSLNTIAMIKEIALTSGSSMKQVRQEIQALFQGQARVTDQFTRMIKITMPELYKQLQNQAITTNEKWKMLIDRVYDFREAQRKAIQTVSNQFLVLKNNIAVISMTALKSSGLWDKWVTSLSDINNKLFDLEGNLLPLGQHIKEVFADIWTSADYAIKSLFSLKDLFGDVYDISVKLAGPWKGAILEGLKYLTVLFAVKTVFQMIIGLGKGLLAASGLRLIIPAMFTAITTSISYLSIAITGLIFKLPALAVGLAGLVGPAIALTGALAGGIAIGASLQVMFSGLWASIKELFDQLASPKFKLAVWEVWDFLKHPLDRSAERINANEYRNKLLAEINGIKDDAKKAFDFNKVIEESMTAMKSTSGLIESSFGEIKNLIKDTLDFDWSGKFGGLIPDFSALEKQLITKMRDLVGPDVADSLVGHFRDLFKNLKLVLGDGIVNINVPLFNFAAWEDKLKDGWKLVNGIWKAVGDIGTPPIQDQGDVAKSIDDAIFKQFVASRRAMISYTNTTNSTLAKQTAEAVKLNIDYQSAIRDIHKGITDFKEMDGVTDAQINTYVSNATTQLKYLELAYKHHLRAVEKPFWGFMVDSMQSWGDSLANTFTQAMMDMNNWKDFLSSWLKDVSSQIINQLIKISITDQLVGGILQVLGAGVGGGMRPNSVTIPHSYTGSQTNYRAGGGPITEHVIGYGTKTGQRWEFGEKGPEYVFNKEQMQSSQSAGNVQVNINNNSQSQVTGGAKTRFDGRKMIIDIVLDDYESGGALYKTLGRKR
jgi:hypothetical protein